MCEISSSMLLKLDLVLFFQAHTCPQLFFACSFSPSSKKILYKAIEDMAPAEKNKDILSLEQVKIPNKISICIER